MSVVDNTALTVALPVWARLIVLPTSGWPLVSSRVTVAVEAAAPSSSTAAGLATTVDSDDDGVPSSTSVSCVAQPHAPPPEETGPPVVENSEISHACAGLTGSTAAPE